jgi:hypothetical protein
LKQNALNRAAARIRTTFAKGFNCDDGYFLNKEMFATTGVNDCALNEAGLICVNEPNDLYIKKSHV